MIYPDPEHIVELFECVKCGQRYPMVPYFGKAAPHGPNRDCTSSEWVKVSDDD